MEHPTANAPIGLFGIHEDFFEAYQSLDERFIKNKTSTFFFRTQTKAMEPTLSEGDFLIVDRGLAPTSKNVCIVTYQGELICRRVYFQQNRCLLLADNKNYKPLVIHYPEESLVWGVVIHSIREIV